MILTILLVVRGLTVAENDSHFTTKNQTVKIVHLGESCYPSTYHMNGLGQVKVEPSCIVCRAEQLACSRTLYISFPMVIYISFCGFLSNEFTLLVSSESSVVVFLSLDCVGTHRSNLQCLGCFANLGLGFLSNLLLGGVP